MLAEIENAVLDKLESGGLSVRDMDVQKGARSIATPAAYVAIEAGEAEKITITSYRLNPTICVVVVFKNIKSERARRHGVYPLLEGVLALLSFQDLDLNINPLIPQRFYNITDAELAQAGLCAYQAEFTTGYTITKADDDQEANDWLRLGLNYYLQDPADDDIVDASDLVELEES